MEDDYEDVEAIPEGLDYGSAPYMFEPEYTDEELREMDEQQAILEQQAAADTGDGDFPQRSAGVSAPGKNAK